MRRAWKSAVAVASLAVIAGEVRAQAPAEPIAPPPNAPPPAAPTAPDQAGQQITITLTSGEVIKGTVKAVQADVVVIVHPVLGEVRVPRVGIAKSEPHIDAVLSPPAVQPPAPPAPAPAPPPPEPKKEEPKPAPAPAPPPPKPPEPKPYVQATNPFAALIADDEKSFWVGWNRNVEVGMNGSTGPSDWQNYRAFVNLARSSAKMNTTANFSYVYGEANSAKNQDRGEATIRNEWKIAGGKWNFWAAGRGEMDALAPWDYQLHASTGLGYTFVKTDNWTLTGRLGAGGRREINGENAILPEVGIFVMTLDYKFSDKTSAYANTEFYPSGRHWDWDNFRSVSRAGMNFIVDPELKMSLRLGVEHRHDSDQMADRANVLDYFVTLGFAF